MKTSRLSRFSPVFPETLGVAFDQHVHALDDEASIVVLHRDDALHPKDLHPEILGNFLNPGDEPVGIHRPARGQRQTGDPIIVRVVGAVLEKLRLDLEDPVQLNASRPSTL
jgi:hypothetical protein